MVVQELPAMAGIELANWTGKWSNGSSDREPDDPAARRELMGVERALEGEKAKDSVDVIASHQPEFTI